MPEEYDAYMEFLRHMNAHRNEPYKPEIVNAVEKEKDLGRKSGYAVYADERPKQERFTDMPEGAINKSKLDEADMHYAIAFFGAVKSEIKEWIESGLISTKSGISIDEEMMDIKGRQEGKELTETEVAMYPEILLTLNKLKEFEIPGETEIFDLLSEIDKKAELFNTLIASKSKLKN